MKKNRNAFFSEYGYNSNMNQGMMMPNPNMGMPQVNASSNFYAGPPVQGPGMPNMAVDMPNDLDARISKIERQINRLETRINKLENEAYPGTGQTNYTENEYNNYTNSMYMV